VIKKNVKYNLVFSALIVFFINACEVDSVIKEELPAENIALVIPQGWPNPGYNFSTNTLTKEGFILGRKLFYEKRLSRNNTISCGSCHQQFAAFSHLDHNVSHGIDGLLGNRNAPGLYNLAWHTNFMWDGGVNHIEVQPLAPINNPVEMDESISNVIAKLQSDAEYRQMFKNAFGTETITSQLIFKAITQFQGIMVSNNSKYDKYKRGETSLTASEANGLTVFQQKCNSCHAAPLFSNFDYINNGLDVNFSKDAGRAKITMAPTDSGKFKVPSLRNVYLTRPYMHDGRFETLDQVLNHYASGVKSSATLHPQLVGGIALSNQEKQDIIAFLKTLSDYTFIQDKRFADPFQ